MDEKLVESYLDNIAELVIDEDKIVTYKSLSKSLGIHVNTAKQLLYTFLTKQKSRNSFPISATYLLAGKLANGSFNISIVNEVNLKSTSLKFVEITSEHVYSIQKGKSLREVKVLSATDKDLSNVESQLVIKCAKCILKSRGEVKKKLNSYQENNKELIEAVLAPKKEPVTEVEEKKSGGFINKDSVAKGPTKKSPKGNSAKAQADAKKPAGNIEKLFAKAHQKNAEKALREDKSASKNKQKDTEPTGPSEIEMVEGKEINLKSEKRSPEKGKESKHGVKQQKKSGSKRRRIQMLSDSEDSDNNGEVPVAEDNSSLTPENIEDEEEVKEFMPRNKRKKRKVIDRTVMNEDGYLETKKEIVFETDSEDEMEEDKKAEPEQKGKIAPISNKGKGIQTANVAKKQSSLLAFFKKN